MKIINMKVDKMRYQNNSFAYLLVLLSLAISIIALFTLINYDTFSITMAGRVVPDFRIALEIVLGIILMMTTFMAAEKVKFYDPRWSKIGLFVLAGINFIRVFNIPFYAMDKGWIPSRVMVTAIVEFIVAGVLLIIAGSISTRKVNALDKHMKELAKHGLHGA